MTSGRHAAGHHPRLNALRVPVTGRPVVAKVLGDVGFFNGVC